jgi:pimeloyl-ACP methyl ester carboxylesterase
VVVWPDGSNDSPSGTRGWNCLGTSHGTGQHGATCHPDRRAWGEYECFDSCGADKCQPIAPDNLTHTCLASSCWDDVGFARELLTWLEDHVCVDLDRVHLTGFSNGAMMVYQLVHILSNRIASIVPVAGAPLLGFLAETVPTTATAVMVSECVCRRGVVVVWGKTGRGFW